MPFKPGEREYRAMPLMVAIDDNGEKTKRLDTDFYVEGYATTYDQPYLMGEVDGIQYFEQIDAGAMKGADISDVIMQYDHAGRVLARGSNGTLLLDPDDPHGLFTAADLSFSNAAKDIHADIKAGLVCGMSWSFTIADKYYDFATHTRHITKIRKVYDVSAVSIPANPETDINARSYCERSAAAEREECAKRLAEIARRRAECLALLSL